MCQTSPSTATRETATLDRLAVNHRPRGSTRENGLEVCVLSDDDRAAIARGLKIAANTLRACMPMGAAALTEADRLERFANLAEKASLVKALYAGVSGETDPQYVSCAGCQRAIPKTGALAFSDGSRAKYFMCASCTERIANPNRDGVRDGGPTQSEASEQRSASEPLPAAVLGAQLPAMLALLEIATNAHVVASMMASNVEGQIRGCIGSCNDSTSVTRKAVGQLRMIAGELRGAVDHATRERDQVVQILDAIVDKAQPPKAAVAIRPSPRPLVKLGPGGEFSIDVKA